MQRIALVTGSNKGIGHATAEALGAEGFHVIAAARDAGRGEQSVARLRERGFSAELLVLDVSDQSGIASAAKAIASRHDHLDVLVNNAGINPEMATGSFDPTATAPELIESVVRTNALGTHELMRRVLPLLRRAPSARVVNLSATLASLGEQSRPGSPYYDLTPLAYIASKVLVNVITVQWSKALVADGIKVNAICPGWVRTEMGGEQAPRTVEQAAAVILRYATLADDGPTGGFFDEDGPVPW